MSLQRSRALTECRKGEQKERRKDEREDGDNSLKGFDVHWPGAARGYKWNIENITSPERVE